MAGRWHIRTSVGIELVRSVRVVIVMPVPDIDVVLDVVVLSLQGLSRELYVSPCGEHTDLAERRCEGNWESRIGRSVLVGLIGRSVQ